MKNILIFFIIFLLYKGITFIFFPNQIIKVAEEITQTKPIQLKFAGWLFVAVAFFLWLIFVRNMKTY